MPQPNQPPPTVESALRISTIIWAAMIVTQGLFIVVTFVQPKREAEPADPTISYALLAVALMVAVASYVIKGRLFAQAAAKRELQGIQAALVVAFAMCETAGILGVFSFFVFGFKYYLGFFAVAVLALLGHMPRRPQFEAAAAPKPIL
jgi:hypothetical protein